MAHPVGASAPPFETFPALRGRPLAFLFNYVRRHPTGHCQEPDGAPYRRPAMGHRTQVGYTRVG